MANSETFCGPGCGPRGGLVKKLVLAILFAAASTCVAAQGSTNQETARWEREARSATIVRDDWGIAHVYGKTDADAVFGMTYAQAEDDFNRDRKSTRLNSSHGYISYAVFCLKKKK